MSEVLARLLDVRPADLPDVFAGAPNGPSGKRAYGGLLTAQALAASGRAIGPGRRPTSLHTQFLRGGDAGEPVRYAVERVYDGRTATSRRVLVGQGGRLLATATASFAASAPGPRHADRTDSTDDPEGLPRTGPIGPAPALPPGEIDIRIHDDGSGVAFVRRMWWRITSALPEDPLVHACAAVFVTDIYGVDPVLAVHGSSMTDRSHRAGTTDSSIWFHDDIRADEWNLMESRSPAAGRGRGVMTAGLFAADGARVTACPSWTSVATRE